MIKYLYQFEDGSIKQCDQGPTDVDILSYEEGCLQIFRIEVTPLICEQVEVSIQKLVGTSETEGIWAGVEEAEVACTHGEEWHE